MWIEGRRRGGARSLSNHLRKTDENESVHIRELEGVSYTGLTGENLEKALKQMEAVGYGKGDKRNLYHAIVAPNYGETLTPAQQKFMADYYAEKMGFKNHQRAVVEHWKKGKQHFHLVFNIIESVTGKTHELKWTKRKEWKISRELEQIFGFSSPVPKGKAVRTKDIQRGKHSSIDPIKTRTEVTRIFQDSKTIKDFISGLHKAGYTLARGGRDQLVLVDRVGDIHGLMRRIEGKRLADLRQKFDGIEALDLPPCAEVAGRRKDKLPKTITKAPQVINPQQVREDVQAAYRTSKTGAAFFAAVSDKYIFGRGLRGFAVIDDNGERYDLDKLLGKQIVKNLHEKYTDLTAIRPRPVSEIIRRMKAKASRSEKKSFAGSIRLNSVSITQPVAKTVLAVSPIRDVYRRMRASVVDRQKQQSTSFKPTPTEKGWPEAAMRDWEIWGKRNPRHFFALWPELKT